MFFLHDAALALLPLAPILAGLAWREGGPRRSAKAALRCACVASAALALAGPMWTVVDRRETRVDVVELTAATTRPTGADNPTVLFSTRAEVRPDASILGRPENRSELQRRLAHPRWPDDAGGANLADALRLAGAQIPDGGLGRIRLVASGRNDHGDAAAEAWRLAQRGIAIEVDPRPLASDAITITRLDVPATARVGQSVTAVATLESTRAGPATVTLAAGDTPPVTIAATLAAGVNRVSATLPSLRAGLVEVRAGVAQAENAPAAPMSVRGAIRVESAADVVFVSDSPADAANAFASLLGPRASVRVVIPDALARAAMGKPDAIVLADVPADRLSDAAQQRLRDAVAAGTGLLVTGAARSFGPGGYDASSLASMLPVRMPQAAEEADPSTTLVLIIDTSGSMQGEAMDLAKEVARSAIQHLRPHDKVGLVEFYGGRRWAAPIQSAANAAVVTRALDRLTAGGGTVMYPAVEEAAFALRNVRTRTKHVLLLSDGGVENDRFATLIRKMADDGVTVSTVQIGPGGGETPLAAIARWGRGRYYAVPDQYVLPDISLKVPQLTLSSPLVRTPSPIVRGDDALTLREPTDGFGTIDAYVRTAPKPTADVLLKTAGGDPLLARWRYGAGFVAAMPTQLGSTMTQSTQGQSALARVVASLVRQIGDGRGDPLQVRPIVRPAGVEVDVTALDAGLAGQVKVTVTDVGGSVIRTAFGDAIAPGHWNVLVPAMTSGTYTIAAEVGDAVGRAGVAVALPVPSSADARLLDQIAAFAPLAERQAALLPPGRQTFVGLRNPLIVLTMILLLAHVAVRRWPARANPGVQA